METSTSQTGLLGDPLPPSSSTQSTLVMGAWLHQPRLRWEPSCLHTIHLCHFSPFPSCHDPAVPGIPPVLKHMPIITTPSLLFLSLQPSLPPIAHSADDLLHSSVSRAVLGHLPPPTTLIRLLTALLASHAPHNFGGGWNSVCVYLCVLCIGICWPLCIHTKRCNMKKHVQVKYSN